MWCDLCHGEFDSLISKKWNYRICEDCYNKTVNGTAIIRIVYNNIITDELPIMQEIINGDIKPIITEVVEENGRSLLSRMRRKV